MRAERGIKINYTTGLIVELVLVLLIVLCTLFRVPRGVSLCFAATFVAFALVTVQYLTHSKVSLMLLLLLLTTFFNVAVNALISRQAQIGFSFFKKMIMFFCTVILFCSASEMKADRKSVQVIEIIPLLTGLAMAVSYFLLGNRVTIAHCITLGFINPNFTGMWLAHVFFFCICFSLSDRRALPRILSALLALACLFLIWKTYARSCFMGILAFAALMMFGYLRKTKTLPKTVIWLILIFPLIFAVVYLYVVHSTWFSELFSFVVRTGKPLTARDQIWRTAFERFASSPILGNYAMISRGTGVSQLHNMHIDVLCSYGALPFLLYLGCLWQITTRVNGRVRTMRQYAAFCAFLSVIVIGGFEASIVAGSTGLYLMTGSFLILAVN